MSYYKANFKLAVFIFKKNLGRLLAASTFLILLYFSFSLLQQACLDVFEIDFVDKLSDTVLSSQTIAFTVSAMIIYFFIGAPLMLGIRKWSFSLCFNKDAGFNDIFEYFSSLKGYVKALCFSFIFFTKRALCYAMFLILPVSVRIVISYFAQNGLFEANEYYIACVLFLNVIILLFTVFAFYYSLKFFMAEYLFFVHNNMNLFKISKSSEDIMRSNKNYIFNLSLMMLPLYALCIFIFPVIFLLPYRNIVFSVAAQQLLSDTVRA